MKTEKKEKKNSQLGKPSLSSKKIANSDINLVKKWFVELDKELFGGHMHTVFLIHKVQSYPVNRETYG